MADTVIESAASELITSRLAVNVICSGSPATKVSDSVSKIAIPLVSAPMYAVTVFDSAFVDLMVKVAVLLASVVVGLVMIVLPVPVTAIFT